MSENSPPYGTGANGDLPRAIPYAEQQIRALCLLAAAHFESNMVEWRAKQWRKFIAEGNWDA